jgi:hypothetical protein
MEGLETYVGDSIAPGRRRGRRLAVYLGLAVLLAAASLVAVSSRGGAPSKFPRVLVPGSSAGCTTPPNGFLFSQVVDGARLSVCISQQGNINQIEYPDTAAGHTQIAFDGYCLFDQDDGAVYQDFSPGAGVTNQGFNAATLTQTAPEILSMTRDTSDGKYRLTEFIKVNVQPRSVFVGMTVKNIGAVTRHVVASRLVAPAIDGSAANDEYNEFGGTGSGSGRTRQAYQSSPVGSNSLVFGATQAGAQQDTVTRSSFQAGNGCISTEFWLVDFGGHVTGGNRVIAGLVAPTVITLAPGASANVGKYVYRML